MATMRVHFWDLGPQANYVRLSLRLGQEITICRSSLTDEGWSSRAETWRYEDGMVINEVITDGCDCDGRHSTNEVYVCPACDLASIENIEGVMMPKWKRVSGRQRDYAAEAMGY